MKKFGPRAQILVYLGVGLLSTIIMSTARLSMFQIYLGFTLLLISYSLCQVAIYSLFYRITARHNIFYIGLFIFATGLLRTILPRSIYWRLEQEADTMMINAWVKYAVAAATVVLGKDYIAPHKMWQIEKNREMINDIGYETINAIKRLDTD
jgi:hypothetical protein